MVGIPVGASDGGSVGARVGAVGPMVGIRVGLPVGSGVGSGVVTLPEGDLLGSKEGDSVGVSVGTALGRPVGAVGSLMVERKGVDQQRDRHGGVVTAIFSTAPLFILVGIISGQTYSSCRSTFIIVSYA
jgi:hypothetical protein